MLVAFGFFASPADQVVGASAALAVAVVGVSLAITESARERALLGQRRAEDDARRIRAERDRTERDLARSKSLFAAVVDGIPNTLSISVADTGEVLDVNERWSEVFGYARDEVIGKSLLDLGVWLDDDGPRSLLDRALRNELGEAEMRVRRRDGEQARLRFSAVSMTLDGVRCLVCYGAEVADRQVGAERGGETALGAVRP